MTLCRHRSGERPLDQGPVLRMDRLDKYCVGWSRCRRIIAENAEVLCRPAHLAGFNIPVPASGLADLLRLDQEGFAPPEILFGLSSNAIFIDQISVQTSILQRYSRL